MRLGYYTSLEDVSFLTSMPVSKGITIESKQETKNTTTEHNLKNTDVMLFGDDDSSVSHGYYNGKSDNEWFYESQYTEDPGRDRSELNQMVLARKNNVKIIAIGRAAIMACAAAGGSVVQSVIGHANKNLADSNGSVTHDICSQIGGVIDDWPSDHFQMIFPFFMDRGDYSVIAYSLSESTIADGSSSESAPKSRKPYYKNAGGDDMIPPTEKDFLMGGIKDSKSDLLMNDLLEPEIVYFRNTDTLAIMGDPNNLKADNQKAFEFLNKVIKLFLTNKL